MDEKQDLVQERDAYKCKVHRLNHAMNALLNSDGFKIIDLDWILAENTFLQESLAQVREEKQLANEMGKRYKAALEKTKSATYNGKSGSKTNNGSNKIHEQITCLIQEVRRKRCQKAALSSFNESLLQTSFPCPLDLRLNDPDSVLELCVALLETLNDRMMQLKHQRKANKHIMDKFKTVEQKILTMENGEILLHPSQFLMRDYSSANVDALDMTDVVKDMSNAEKLITAPGSKGFSPKHHEITESTSPEPDSSEDDDVSNSDDVRVDGDLPGDESIVRTNPPPDIIVQSIEREKSRSDEACAKLAMPQGLDGLEESITLPDHLQLLVDQAMKSLAEQET